MAREEATLVEVSAPVVVVVVVVVLRLSLLLFPQEVIVGVDKREEDEQVFLLTPGLSLGGVAGIPIAGEISLRLWSHDLVGAPFEVVLPLPLEIPEEE